MTREFMFQFRNLSAQSSVLEHGLPPSPAETCYSPTSLPTPDSVLHLKGLTHTLKLCLYPFGLQGLHMVGTSHPWEAGPQRDT